MLNTIHFLLSRIKNKFGCEFQLVHFIKNLFVCQNDIRSCPKGQTLQWKKNQPKFDYATIHFVEVWLVNRCSCSTFWTCINESRPQFCWSVCVYQTDNWIHKSHLRSQFIVKSKSNSNCSISFRYEYHDDDDDDC